MLEHSRKGPVNTPLQHGLVFQAGQEEACLWTLGLTLELTPGQTPGPSLLSDWLGFTQVPSLLLVLALHAGIASSALQRL